MERKTSVSRTNLVDFQNRLNDQLENAMASDRVTSWMSFHAARTNWLINIGDTKEISTFPENVFGFDVTRPWMMGIGNFRGDVHSLVDFSLFLGGEPTPININTRVLLAHSKYDTNIALVVPQVFGLKRMDSLSKRNGTAKSSVWVNEVFEDKAGAKWEFLDLNGLISSREMMEVEA